MLPDTTNGTGEYLLLRVAKEATVGTFLDKQAVDRAITSSQEDLIIALESDQLCDHRATSDI